MYVSIILESNPPNLGPTPIAWSFFFGGVTPQTMVGALAVSLPGLV